MFVTFSKFYAIFFHVLKWEGGWCFSEAALRWGLYGNVHWQALHLRISGNIKMCPPFGVSFD